jgi:hypothetical protein
MRLIRRRSPEPPPAPPLNRRQKPPWEDLIDPLERPSREDRSADHSVFGDTLLEPVPLPKWLRGRKRSSRDKLS